MWRLPKKAWWCHPQHIIVTSYISGENNDDKINKIKKLNIDPKKILFDYYNNYNNDNYLNPSNIGNEGYNNDNLPITNIGRANIRYNNNDNNNI